MNAGIRVHADRANITKARLTKRWERMIRSHTYWSIPGSILSKVELNIQT